MKKVFITLVATIMAVSASAQVYVGGGIGLGSTKVGDGDSQTTYKFVPEVGYNFDKNWAAGIAFGWEGNDDTTTFMINPYARYTFVHSKFVNVFFDTTVGYAHNNAGKGTDSYEFGFKPGVAVNLNSNFSFVAHVGFLGYRQTEYDKLKTKSWGVNLEGNDVVFGLYYNF